MPAWLGWVAVVLLSLYLAIFPAAAAGLAWRWGRGEPADAGAAPRRRLDRHRMAARRRCSPASPGTRSASSCSRPASPGSRPGSAPTACPASRSWPAASLLLAGRRAAERKAALLTFAALAAAAALAWATRPALPPSAAPAIRIVQPNIGQQNKWDPGYRGARISAASPRLTGRPGARAAADPLARGGDPRFPVATSRARAAASPR